VPVDLSKLSDEELDAYLALKEGNKGSTLTLPDLPAVHKPYVDKAGKDMREVLTPNLVFDKAMKETPIANPIMAFMPNGKVKEEINKRYLGAAGGAATGTGPVTAGLFSALGAAAPPQNAGDAASAGVGLGIGGKLGQLVSHIPGMKGVLASALAGAGENAAVQGSRSAMTGEKPDINAGNTALGAAVPLVAKGLFQSPAKDSTYGKARKFLNELTGAPLEPSEVPNMPGVTSSANPKNNLLSPMGRVFAQTQNNAAKKVAAQDEIVQSAKANAQSLKNKVTQLRGQQVKLQGLIDSAKRSNKRGVGRMDQQFQDMENDYIQPALDDAIRLTFGDGKQGQLVESAKAGLSKAMQDKEEILAARKQLQAAKTGQLKVPEGPLDTSVENAKVETLQQNLQKTKEALFKSKQEADDFAKLELPKVQEALRKAPAIDPKLQQFTKTSTPSEFLDTLIKADHESVTALRNQLSPAGKKALEESFSKTFAKMAIGPDGSLSNIEAASKAFPYDKVSAIYGGKAIGQAKAELAARATSDTLRLMKENSGVAGMVRKVGAAGVLGNAYVLLHAMRRPSLGAAAAEAGAIGGTVLAVKWPKIIDKAVSDPKWGAEFHKWATDESPTAALKNYPLVERFLKENNDYVEKAKEKASELTQ
jgi:hypothetical protein